MAAPLAVTYVERKNDVTPYPTNLTADADPDIYITIGSRCA